MLKDHLIMIQSFHCNADVNHYQNYFDYAVTAISLIAIRKIMQLVILGQQNVINLLFFDIQIIV